MTKSFLHTTRQEQNEKENHKKVFSTFFIANCKNSGLPNCQKKWTKEEKRVKSCVCVCKYRTCIANGHSCFNHHHVCNYNKLEWWFKTKRPKSNVVALPTTTCRAIQKRTSFTNFTLNSFAFSFVRVSAQPCSFFHQSAVIDACIYIFPIENRETINHFLKKRSKVQVFKWLAIENREIPIHTQSKPHTVANITCFPALQGLFWRWNFLAQWIHVLVPTCHAVLKTLQSHSKIYINYNTSLHINETISERIIVVVVLMIAFKRTLYASLLILYASLSLSNFGKTSKTLLFSPTFTQRSMYSFFYTNLGYLNVPWTNDGRWCVW